jgi:hypothetical protein
LRRFALGGVRQRAGRGLARVLAISAGEVPIGRIQRAALRAGWLTDVEDEIERRRAARIAASPGSKARLIAKLGEMDEPLRRRPTSLNRPKPSNAAPYAKSKAGCIA